MSLSFESQTIKQGKVNRDLTVRLDSGVDFLEFKPSEIAAATALSVMIEAQTMNIENAITCCCNVDKVKIVS